MRGLGVGAMRQRAKSDAVATVIVDKSALFRAGLIYTLADTHFKVIAECARLDELERSAFASDKCYVFLIDLDESFEDNELQIAELRKACERSYFVFLGDFVDTSALHWVLNMGGACYMLKDEVTVDGLLRSLDIIISGAQVFSQGFMNQLRREWLPRVNIEDAPLRHVEAALELTSCATLVASEKTNLEVQLSDRHEVRLSDRENAILMGLMQGASNKHIARDLQIAEATVKVHVKSVLRKIRVKNRTQAAMWAWTNQGATKPHDESVAFIPPATNSPLIRL
jgi:DNA-binding NarL/FixJ family response regulator